MNNTLFLLQNKEFNEDDFGAFLQELNHYRQLLPKFEHLQNCKKQALAEGLTPDAVKMQQLANEFRYEHDLLTGEDLLYWLEVRRLNVEDFQDYIEQCYWLGRIGEKIPGGVKGTLRATEINKYLHLSGHFELLLFHWQKKLMAWYERHKKAFADFSMLKENYKTYCETLRESWDCSSWLQVYKKEFDKVKLQLYHFETRESALAAELELHEIEAHESVEELRAELPQWLQQNAHKAFLGELVGPHLIDERWSYCRILEIENCDLQNDQVKDRVFELFMAEHWETLKVKLIHVC